MHVSRCKWAVFCLYEGAVRQPRTSMACRRISSRTAGRCQAMEMIVSVYESSEFRLILPKQTEVARIEKNFRVRRLSCFAWSKKHEQSSVESSAAWPLVVLRDLDLFRRLVLSARWMRSHVAIAGIKEQAAANNCAKHQHGHGVIVPPAKQNDPCLS